MATSFPCSCLMLLSNQDLFPSLPELSLSSKYFLSTKIKKMVTLIFWFGCCLGLYFRTAQLMPWSLLVRETHPFSMYAERVMSQALL